MPEIDKFLIREYRTFDVLDLPIEEGLEFYYSALRLREEERLYTLWVGFKTSMGGSSVPVYSEFSEGIFGGDEDRKTAKKKRESNGLGTIRGEDLTQG